jgi:hypothetical protein
MRLRFLNFLMLMAIFAAAAVGVHAQQSDAPQDPNDDETARGAFLSSRPPAGSSGSALAGGAGAGSSAGTSGLTSVTKPAAGKSTSGRTTTTRRSTGRSTANASGRSNSGNAAVNNYAAHPIGLGYSIYMRDAASGAIRVDPTRSFRSGESIRVQLESNTNGYLYIFNTENDGAPEMLYPDARLAGGKNWIDAHVPHEIPSSSEAVEGNRWFTFDNNPAVERLYIVISREPLPAIPTGAALVRICQQNSASCPLKMNAQDWSQVKSALDAKVVVSRQRTYGQAQSSTEVESTARGMYLTQDAPQPTVVRMSAVTTAKTLVTAIDLNHSR